MESVTSGHGGVYFLYGCGGIGKTFIWNTLSAAVRSKGEIVLNVASSGIASLLLPGGQTTHSRFAIQLNPNEDSTCNISQGSLLAQLIIKTKLIIWDETPMIYRYCFEALNRTLRDITKVEDSSFSDQPFGYKTIVFGGDFRQILPVILNRSRQDIVHATINASSLWTHCKVLKLTKKRLQSHGDDDSLVALKDFSNWILSIGDGTVRIDNDGHATVEVLTDFLVDALDDPVQSMVDGTYPSFLANYNDVSYLQEKGYTRSNSRCSTDCKGTHGFNASR